MKKIIIGALALLTIGIGGFAISNKVVRATNTDDKAKIKLTTTTEKIETFKNSEFEIKLSINPGFIKFDTKLQPGITLTENILKINKDPLVTLIDATRIDVKSSESTKLIVGERIDLGKIEYVPDPAGYQDVGAGVHDFIGKKFDIVLKFRANDIGILDNISNHFTLEYRDRNSNFIKESVSGSVKVDIKEISYKPGKIIGIGIDDKKDENGSLYYEYPMNKFFTMKYKINPGKLVAVDKEGNGTSLNSLNLKENRLIYTIDKSIIDEVGGNDETARESLIKSLQILKDSNPDAKVSLIAFDDKAEVISVEDKEILSVDSLISEIEKIEPSDKAGNLGEAIRMTQVLINKEENPSSVILVTGENPNYYTQVSEGNKSMLYTRVEKDGVSKEDYETAQEYVNTVVNDIAVNEEKKTRWYSVNYNRNDEEERIIDEVIRKFEGYSLDIKRPYYGDFELLNERAISPVILRMEVTAEGIDKDFVEVHEESKSQTLEFVFNKKDGNGNLVSDEQEIEVLARIKNVDNRNPVGVDVADIRNIKVTAKALGIEGEKTNFIFNDPITTEGKDLLVWRVKPITPYFIEYGLFKGAIDKGNEVEKCKKEAKTEIERVACEVLEDLSEVDLAIENTFETGILIQTKTEQIIEPKIKLNNKKEIVKKAKVYEYKNGSLDLFKEAEKVTLEANKMYLIVINEHIYSEKEKNLVNKYKIGDNFEIGIDIANNNEKIDKEFWGVKVNVVDKPEHF